MRCSRKPSAPSSGCGNDEAKAQPWSRPISAHREIRAVCKGPCLTASISMASPFSRRRCAGRIALRSPTAPSPLSLASGRMARAAGHTLSRWRVLLAWAGARRLQSWQGSPVGHGRFPRCLPGRIGEGRREGPGRPGRDRGSTAKRPTTRWPLSAPLLGRSPQSFSPSGRPFAQNPYFCTGLVNCSRSRLAGARPRPAPVQVAGCQAAPPRTAARICAAGQRRRDLGGRLSMTRKIVAVIGTGQTVFRATTRTRLTSTWLRKRPWRHCATRDMQPDEIDAVVFSMAPDPIHGRQRRRQLGGRLHLGVRASRSCACTPAERPAARPFTAAICTLLGAYRTCLSSAPTASPRRRMRSTFST